jgi:hypothetical protein
MLAGRDIRYNLETFCCAALPKAAEGIFLPCLTLHLFSRVLVRRSRWLNHYYKPLSGNPPSARLTLPTLPSSPADICPERLDLDDRWLASYIA